MSVGTVLFAIHMSGRWLNAGCEWRPLMMNSMVTDSSCLILGYRASRIFVRIVLCFAMYSSRSPPAVIMVRLVSCYRVRCVVVVESVKWSLISATSCRGVTFGSRSIVPTRSERRLVNMLMRKNAHFLR